MVDKIAWIRGLRLLLSMIVIGSFCTCVYGKTRTDKMLEQDILSNLIVVDPQTKTTVQPEVVSQDIVKVTDNESTGAWQEILEKWVIRWGKQEAVFFIKLVPSSQGGVDFSIIPEEAAKKLGLI